MISLLPIGAGNQRKLRRRDVLQLGALGTLGCTLPQLPAIANAAGSHKGTAKNCIYIFLCGGPSQLEMWDPKPEAPKEIRGPFKPIATNVPGMQIGELLPQVAKHADKLALVRSMHHDSNVHDIGILYTLLGTTLVPSKRAYPPARSDHPGMGAILRSLLGNNNELPAWVTVPRPFTTGARFYKGQSAGFLGPGHDPFFLNLPKKDSLGEKEFGVEALKPLEGLSQQRIAQRKNLLAQLDASSAKTTNSQATEQFRRYHDKAYSMLSSSGAQQAFDLKRENGKLRDRYGRNEYGQSFLLARRLVESGVRMVNVFWTFYGEDGCQFNLWDNHGTDKKVCGGFNKGVDMLTAPYCCPSFDKAYSALLEDLDQRGLLDETMVVVVGEFGRTPKINKHTGRDHWGSCYSMALAGGGVRGGQVFGASDKHAAYVKDSPVTVDNLSATILHAFGFTPEAPIYDAADRPVRSSRGEAITALF